MEIKVTKIIDSDSLDETAKVEMYIDMEPIYGALFMGVSREEIALMLGDRLLEALA